MAARSTNIRIQNFDFYTLCNNGCIYIRAEDKNSTNKYDNIFRHKDLHFDESIDIEKVHDFIDLIIFAKKLVNELTLEFDDEQVSLKFVCEYDCGNYDYNLCLKNVLHHPIL